MYSKLIRCIAACLLVLMAGCHNLNNETNTSTMKTQSEMTLGLEDYQKFLYWQEVNSSRLEMLNVMLDQAIKKGDAYQYLQILVLLKDEVAKNKSIWKDLDFRYVEVVTLKAKTLELLELLSEILNDTIQSLLQYNTQTISPDELQLKSERLSEKGNELDSLIDEVGNKLGYFK